MRKMAKEFKEKAAGGNRADECRLDLSYLDV
jgi:hypothetical protein